MLPEPTCFVNNDSTGDLLPTDGFVYNKSINIKTSAFFLGRNSSMQWPAKLLVQNVSFQMQIKKEKWEESIV